MDLQCIWKKAHFVRSYLNLSLFHPTLIVFFINSCVLLTKNAYIIKISGKTPLKLPRLQWLLLVILSETSKLSVCLFVSQILRNGKFFLDSSTNLLITKLLFFIYNFIFIKNDKELFFIFQSSLVEMADILINKRLIC